MGIFVKQIYLTTLFVSIIIAREVNIFILIYLNIYLHEQRPRTPVRTPPQGPHQKPADWKNKMRTILEQHPRPHRDSFLLLL